FLESYYIRTCLITTRNRSNTTLSGIAHHLLVKFCSGALEDRSFSFRNVGRPRIAFIKRCAEYLQARDDMRVAAQISAALLLGLATASPVEAQQFGRQGGLGMRLQIQTGWLPASLTTVAAPSFSLPAIQLGLDWATGIAGTRLTIGEGASA